MTGVRMQAQKAWLNRKYEGNVEKGDFFVTRNERRAMVLEAMGHAVRAEGKAAPGNLQPSTDTARPSTDSLAPALPLSLPRDRRRAKPISRDSSNQAEPD